MSQHQSPPQLDVKHAAQLSLQLSGEDVLLNYKRLMQETCGLGAENALQWSVHAHLRKCLTGRHSVWLHLTATTTLPLSCQRCLESVDIDVHIDRDFRFVGSEAMAEQEDEACEEDVLVWSHAFNVQTLIEDEILMELPLVPRHTTCPVEIKMAVADLECEDIQDHHRPFAVLTQLQSS